MDGQADEKEKVILFCGSEITFKLYLILKLYYGVGSFRQQIFICSVI